LDADQVIAAIVRLRTTDNAEGFVICAAVTGVRSADRPDTTCATMLSARQSEGSGFESTLAHERPGRRLAGHSSTQLLLASSPDVVGAGSSRSGDARSLGGAGTC
jgi:hypothetical protein